MAMCPFGRVRPLWGKRVGISSGGGYRFVRGAGQIALDLERFEGDAFTGQRNVWLVLGRIANDAYRLLTALHLVDLFEQQIAEQDDAFVRCTQTLGGPVAD